MECEFFPLLKPSAESDSIRFIWVKHQIKRVCDEMTEDSILKALTELPEDLDEIYLEILCTIRAHQSKRTVTMAETALKWVLYAVRPLSPEELIGAVSTSCGLTVPALLDICHNLLVLDVGLGVLRFAHFSVQEFLLKQFSPEGGHTGVAEVCLTILLTVDGDMPAMADYAIDNWAEHVRLSGTGSGVLTKLCTIFLDSSSVAYKTWASKVILRQSGPYELRPSRSETIEPLLVAVYYQLEVIFARLLLTADPSSVNRFGRTSCHLAAMNGSQGIMRLLCDKEGVDLDCREAEYGKTPLSWASWKGYEGVV